MSFKNLLVMVKQTISICNADKEREDEVQ
jgi:hypothetical protein